MQWRGYAALAAAAVVAGCVATIEGKPELLNAGLAQAALPRSDLRAGLYVSPAVRAYSFNESWARFAVGQSLETQASAQMANVFKSVQPLAVFPPSANAVPDVDVVVAIEQPQAQFTADFMDYAMNLTTGFTIQTPDGQPIRTASANSSLVVIMGSIDPSENIQKAYEAVDLLAADVVTQLLKDFPKAEVEKRLAESRRIFGRRPSGAGQRQTASLSSGLPNKPEALTFAAGAERPDDIAVIIGNADYAKLGRDIPDVVPAYADAEGFRQYVTQSLGVREGNVIAISDATGAQLVRVFGSKDNPRGQLYDWVRPGRSRVYIYYAGHGAPGGRDGTAYLVPTDADAARIELNGYPLETLYANLGRLPAESIMVVLEACFSGVSQAGSVIARSSAIYAKPRDVKVPPRVTVVAAGGSDQVASWEENDAHSLFTKYFLRGMAGEADQGRSGNRDGTISWSELDAYLKDTLTYYARRYYGRDQTAQIVVGK